MQVLRGALGCLLLGLAVPAAYAQYGIGVTANVPRISPVEVRIDGVIDETEAWSRGLEVDLTANWDGAWSGHPDADVIATARLLYAPDTLYVYAVIEDYQPLYFPAEGEGDGWSSEQFLLGIDPNPDPDSVFVDENWQGFLQYGWAPDSVWGLRVWDRGFLLGDDSTDAVANGWINGRVFIDEASFVWGFEAAIYVPGLAPGSEIGFNIGGATAADGEEAGAYAFFAWQGTEAPGGNMWNSTANYALLRAQQGTSVEDPGGEMPQAYVLGQNYPNPFNPSTDIEYAVPRAGQVTIAVYNALGQRVATLVDVAQTAGTYRVRWEAGGQPSGVYLYQMQVDGATVASKKMLLLK